MWSLFSEATSSDCLILGVEFTMQQTFTLEKVEQVKSLAFWQNHCQIYNDWIASSLFQLIIQHQSSSMACIMNKVHLLSHNMKLFLDFIKKKINSNQCCSIYLLLICCIHQKHIAVTPQMKLNTFNLNLHPLSVQPYYHYIYYDKRCLVSFATILMLKGEPDITYQSLFTGLEEYCCMFGKSCMKPSEGAVRSLINCLKWCHLLEVRKTWGEVGSRFLYGRRMRAIKKDICGPAASLLILFFFNCPWSATVHGTWPHGRSCMYKLLSPPFPVLKTKNAPKNVFKLSIVSLTGLYKCNAKSVECS